MIYLRALGLFLVDWITAWADDDDEHIDYRGAIAILRALDGNSSDEKVAMRLDGTK